MAIYIGALGNSPAAVLPGIRWVQTLESLSRIVLYRELGDGEVDYLRQEALKTLLEAQYQIAVDWVDPATPIRIDDFSFVDMTGGSKIGKLAALGTASLCTLFSTNLRGEITVLEGSHVSPTQNFAVSTDEFLKLHLESCQGLLQAVTLGFADLSVDTQVFLMQVLPGNSEYRLLIISGRKIAVFKYGNTLQVLELELGNPKSEELRGNVRRLADIAEQLGGNRARALFRAFGNATDDARKRSVVEDEDGLWLEVGQSVDTVLKTQRESYSDDVPRQVKKPHRPNGAVLAYLLGEQVAPVLISIAHHTRLGLGISQVYAFSSVQQTPALGRLRVVLEQRTPSVPVQVLTNLKTETGFETAQKMVRSIFAVAKHRPVVLNINGGTAAMMLGAYRAFMEKKRDIDRLEYVDFDTIVTIHPQQKRDVVIEPAMSVGEFLNVHGVKHLPTKTHLTAPSVEAREASIVFCEQHSEETALAWKFHAQDFLKFNPSYAAQSDVKAGDLLDYRVCYDLNRHLGMDVFQLGVFLDYQKWNGSAVSGNDFSERVGQHETLTNELDGIGIFRQQLVIIECKIKLQDAFSSVGDSARKLVQLADRCGGRYARGVIVGHQARKMKDQNVLNNFKSALLRRSRLERLTVWICNSGAKHEGLLEVETAISNQNPDARILEFEADLKTVFPKYSEDEKLVISSFD